MIAKFYNLHVLVNATSDKTTQSNAHAERGERGC